MITITEVSQKHDVGIVFICAKYRYRRYIDIADILVAKISISYRFQKGDIDPALTVGLHLIGPYWHAALC